MKTLISVVLLLVAPMLSHALSIEDARHLWSRTGFHNADFILNDYSDYSRDEAVALMLDSGAYTAPVTTLLEFDDELFSSTLS